MAQFYGSPSPPYPLAHPTFFDVPHPHSGWAVRRCQHALSPTIEEISPTTTTPVSRHSAYANYFQWDRQNTRCSKAGDGLRQYPDEGQWSAESGSDHRDQFMASATVPWSSTAACADQPSGLGNAASSQQDPMTAQWHFRGRHTRRETF